MIKYNLHAVLGGLWSKKIIYREISDEDDFEFIIARCHAEAEAGHFSKIYADPNPDIQRGLRKQIACAATGLPYPLEPWNPRNGTGSLLKIIEVDKRRAGFLLLLEDMPGSKNEKVELHLMSLVPEQRGKGLGTRIVQDVLRMISARQIYARCYKESTSMIVILKNIGFTVVDVSSKETKTLLIAR